MFETGSGSPEQGGAPEPPRGLRSQHELYPSSYPRTCPQCGGALPVTRRRFPLVRTVGARRTILAGGLATLLGAVGPLLLALVGGLCGWPWGGPFLLVLLASDPLAAVGLWGLLLVPGSYVLMRGLRMPRFHRVECAKCGCVLYVDSQGL